jgi:Flp pilus assembly protein TadD
MGRALSRRGDHEKAMAQFEKALEVAPTLGEVHYALAMELLASGDQKKAVARLGEALRHNPRHVESHRQLGLLFLSGGKPALALPQLRAVLRDRPDDAQAHFDVGRCFALLKREEEAIASYREALRIRPEWPEASNQLAWLLATSHDDRLRNGAEAKQIAQAALKVAELRQPLLLDTMAAASAAEGDFAGAVATQERAIASANTLGNSKLVSELRKHAASYAKKEPLRENPPSSGTATEAKTE